MKVDKLTLKNFRNIENIALIPSETVNLIAGDNAQGKTNLIEAIWMFTGGRSFRGAKESELIRLGQPAARLELQFTSQKCANNAVIQYADKKRILLNGAEKKSGAALSAQFCCTVFAPSHLLLIKGSPAERRQFIDSALCQLSPLYQSALHDYKRALLQRAAVLKKLRFEHKKYDLLDVWDHNLSQLDARIVNLRLRYLKKLSIESAALYQKIAGSASYSEEISVTYASAVPVLDCFEDAKETQRRYLYALLDARAQDEKTFSTSVGVHRDDLQICLNNLCAKSYASQGQQRSCVLSLKLAESHILKERFGEPTIVLLDDVMSELDEKRQSFVLEQITGQQVFITCCDPSFFLRNGHSCPVIRIQNGGIVTT